MYKDDKLKSTIFDDVKPFKQVHSNVKEFESFVPSKVHKPHFTNEKLHTNILDFKSQHYKPSRNNDKSFYNYFHLPDKKLMEQNPEYKFKYPKLSMGQIAKQNWQTEEGTPNQLNQFLRQEETGVSLEDIAYDDNKTIAHNNKTKDWRQDIADSKIKFDKLRNDILKSKPQTPEELKTYSSKMTEYNKIYKENKVNNYSGLTTHLKSPPTHSAPLNKKVIIKPAIISPATPIIDGVEESKGENSSNQNTKMLRESFVSDFENNLKNKPPAKKTNPEKKKNNDFLYKHNLVKNIIEDTLDNVAKISKTKTNETSEKATDDNVAKKTPVEKSSPEDNQGIKSIINDSFVFNDLQRQIYNDTRNFLTENYKNFDANTVVSKEHKKLIMNNLSNLNFINIKNTKKVEAFRSLLGMDK